MRSKDQNKSNKVQNKTVKRSLIKKITQLKKGNRGLYIRNKSKNYPELFRCHKHINVCRSLFILSFKKVTGVERVKYLLCLLKIVIFLYTELTNLTFNV